MTFLLKNALVLITSLSLQAPWAKASDAGTFRNGDATCEGSHRSPPAKISERANRPAPLPQKVTVPAAKLTEYQKFLSAANGIINFDRADGIELSLDNITLLHSEHRQSDRPQVTRMTLLHEEQDAKRWTFFTVRYDETWKVIDTTFADQKLPVDLSIPPLWIAHRSAVLLKLHTSKPSDEEWACLIYAGGNFIKSKIFGDLKGFDYFIMHDGKLIGINRIPDNPNAHTRTVIDPL